MESKRGQGISLNFIVVAIIAALVLVIIIAFTVGGLGSSLSQIFLAGEETDDSSIELAKANCKSMCDEAKGADNPEAWNEAEYCTEKYLFDGDSAACWQAPINVRCSISGKDIYSEVWECDETTCGSCDEIICTANLPENDDTCDGLGYNDCIAEIESVELEDGTFEDVQVCDWGQ
jgi:hypothetical protein